MQGLDLLKMLVQSTGLPQDAVEREVARILATKNYSAENLTLDQLREVLAVYLQDVLVETKSTQNSDLV